MTNEQLIQQIATLLNEPETTIIARAMRVLGAERLIALTHDVLAIEGAGGEMVRDGSRRRTPGGTLVQMIKCTATADERKLLFARRFRKTTGAMVVL